ncbi:type IV secretory system conjugative DNA transfer family protein [Streptomyces sp. NPDC046859]|uniref:type IV secretory system conjugative DNA transfer family protein n=1 Tax=Streptomyces sp. NPDC046859 TaxID=3155734 RepID=UPI0033E1F567
MRPDDRGERRHREGQGGIPDGLLIGILGFLLGMTLMVWTATGLAGLFAHGSWPDGVTVPRTPLAMRSLIGDPHDLAGAWPDTPEGQLSGYGLFWGLFIGQLMVMVVLTVFVMGTLARWRAVRAARRAGRPYASAAPAPHEVPAPRTEPEPTPEARQPVPAPEPRQTAPAVERRQPEAVVEHAGLRTETAPPAPPPAGPALAPLPAAVTARETVLVAPRDARLHSAAQAVLDAEGAALVVTSNPALWQDTKDARGKLGPVLLYDPSHLCDTPARLHWSPTTGCEDKATAASRAAALLAPVRPASRLDQAVGDTAETLLRSYLHAAAVDGRTVRHVHRWSQGSQIQDAVRILRTHPKAAPGSAGELEAALTAHPERRDMAQELTTRALAALSMVNIRESCTPHRTDALTLDSFVHETGTLYVVGESIEDPRAEPGAMPLLTALAASVVERGRRMAERSSSGRLDPPMTLVLDDVAAVAPLPQVPELLASGADRGMPTLALLRSREQARSRWPHAELPG